MERALILSIIVPVYNVAPWLSRCVDSLLRQELADDTYEILLVDDGSTDGSGAICDRYAASCRSVRVLRQENQGVSVARNAGLNAARGVYLEFVDADDYLEPDVLPRLLARMEHESLDVLRFGFRFADDNGPVPWPYKSKGFSACVAGTVCDGIRFMNERLGVSCYTVQFLVRAACAERGLCRFEPGVAVLEDTLWLASWLPSARRVADDSAIVYNYYRRISSATLNPAPEHRKRILDNVLYVAGKLVQAPDLNAVSVWRDRIVAHLCISAYGEIVKYRAPERARYEKRLRSVVPGRIRYPGGSVRNRMKCAVINVSPVLYSLVLRSWRALRRK